MTRTFITSGELERRTLLPGADAHFVHSSSMTMAFWSFEPGVDLPEHSHPHEQITTIIEGDFELRINGQTRRLLAGDVAIIESNAIHSGRSQSHCRVIDTFHPVREDLK
jgi:quercetin dioxygenase-like cupin family protein